LVLEEAVQRGEGGRGGSGVGIVVLGFGGWLRGGGGGEELGEVGCEGGHVDLAAAALWGGGFDVVLDFVRGRHFGLVLMGLSARFKVWKWEV